MSNEGPGLERFRRFVDEVRERVDLSDVVGDDAKLEKVSGGWRCKSPLRANDTDPSFYVYRDGRYWDFGTSEGGDVFDYLMRKHGVGFREAVNIAAERVGLVWQSASGEHGLDAETMANLNKIVERRDVERILATACEFYHARLTKGARRYLKDNYGLTKETIDAERIGWAPGGTTLLKHLADELKLEPESLARSGLFVATGEGVKDFFDKRLVFWYWRHGRPVYAIGRRVDGITSDADHEKAKYRKLLVHSDKHEYVSPTISNEWFAGEDSLKGNPALLIVTEGITDCIAARQAGFPTISPVTITYRERDWQKLGDSTANVGKIVIINDRDLLADGRSPGIEGALKTAAHLWELGRDVCIGELPPRADGTKNDIAEFLKSGGNLKAVVAKAKPYPEFLVDRIDDGLSPSEVQARLGEVCALMAKRGPVEREAFVNTINKRFKLGKRVARELVDQHIERTPTGAVAAERYTNVRGMVIEDIADHYLVEMNAMSDVISSFVIRPRALVKCEIGTLVEGDVVTEKGMRIPGVQFEPGAWTSARTFTRFVNGIHPSLQWTGSDAQVQGVLRIVTEHDVPTHRGTTVIGRHEIESGPRWVWPGGVFGPPGERVTDEFVFVATPGSGVVRHLDYNDRDEIRTEDIARAVLPRLPGVNAPEVIWPMIGWFFATPLKPITMRVLGHFPILFVWGSQGGGKTSTVRDLFLPMFGAGKELRPLSATETPFALIRVLGVTNSVPLFFDEYKSDMGRGKIETLHRLMRRAYGGEIEERGRADQSVASYALLAPMGVAGESFPIGDAALRERLVCVNPNPNWLRDHPEARALFTELTAYDLNALAAPIARYTLGLSEQKIGSMIREAAVVAENILKAAGRERRDVPLRCFDALIVMCLGIMVYENVCEALTGERVETDTEALVVATERLVAELLEGEGPLVKDQFDGFIEALTDLALAGTLIENKHYAWFEGKLCVHLPGSHRVYLEAQRKAGLEDQTNGAKALKRTAREKFERGESYVVGIDHRLRFGNLGQVRCILIDPERVPDTLTFERWPCSASRSWGGDSRWDSERESD
jgi:DNA primase catalytic core